MYTAYRKIIFKGIRKGEASSGLDVKQAAHNMGCRVWFHMWSSEQYRVKAGYTHLTLWAQKSRSGVWELGTSSSNVTIGESSAEIEVTDRTRIRLISSLFSGVDNVISVTLWRPLAYGVRWWSPTPPSGRSSTNGRRHQKQQ